MPRSFWWKYNLHYVYNLYATGIRFRITLSLYLYLYCMYMNGCRHTFYVISFNKATHNFTMPCSIYNRNLYYVLNGCYCGIHTVWVYLSIHIYNKTYPHQSISTISLHTFYMERSNHLGTYNKIHKSSGSI